MAARRRIWTLGLLLLALASCTGLSTSSVDGDNGSLAGKAASTDDLAATAAPSGVSGSSPDVFSSGTTPSAELKHPLVVQRHLRVADLTFVNGDLWHSRWLDLSEGRTSGTRFDAKAVVKCTIHNAADYLLGKPGAKTCLAGVVPREQAKFSTAGSLEFDALKEAWLDPWKWRDVRAPGATGDLILVRFGDPGPTAHYAKFVITEADTKFVEVSWAFQTRPGVRVLDAESPVETYRQDAVPTPTPVPTPYPTPTKRPKDPTVAKALIDLDWYSLTNFGKSYQESTWLSLYTGATFSTPVGVAIQFQRRVSDGITPSDPNPPAVNAPVTNTVSINGMVVGRKGVALSFQRICGETSRPQTLDAPLSGWYLAVFGGYFYDGPVFNDLDKCEILFRSDGPRYGKLAISSVTAPESGKRTPPIRLELWIQPATGSLFLE